MASFWASCPPSFKGVPINIITLVGFQYAWESIEVVHYITIIALLYREDILCSTCLLNKNFSFQLKKIDKTKDGPKKYYTAIDWTNGRKEGHGWH